MVGQCLRFALFSQKFVVFGGKSARWGVKKWSDWKFFFPPFLTFYRFTRTVQWYFVKGVDLKVPYTRPSIAWSEFSLAGAIFYTYVVINKQI